LHGRLLHERHGGGVPERHRGRLPTQPALTAIQAIGASLALRRARGGSANSAEPMGQMPTGVGATPIPNHANRAREPRWSARIRL
jgi:hypothetical protein